MRNSNLILTRLFSLKSHGNNYDTIIHKYEQHNFHMLETKMGQNTA